MEYIVLNLKPQVRTEQLGGREYLVAPITLLRSRVLAGSEGPLFYPQNHISDTFEAWNGMPIVIGHPSDSAGNPVSARDPLILEKQGIGHIYRSSVDKGPLEAEAWFDKIRTQEKDPRIIEALRKGEPMEVSTGLFTQNVPAPQNSRAEDGTPYEYIATNYRPDHLAILPDEKGACSVEDGCGIFVGNGEFDKIPSDLKEALNSIQSLGFNVKVYSLSPENTDVSNVRSKNTGQFKKTGSGSGKDPSHSSSQSGFLVIDDSDKELCKNLDPTTNPAWVQDEDTWERAKESASKSGHEEDWPYITAVYKKLGGVVGNSSINNAEYPWEQCISDQKEKYGDEETAKKVCGTIKAKNNSRQDCEDIEDDDDYERCMEDNKATNNGGPGSGPHPSGVSKLAQDIHSHLKSEGKQGIRDLRAKFGGKAKFNPHDPLKHPVHAALKELVDKGHANVHQHSSGFGEPSFSANKSVTNTPTKGKKTVFNRSKTIKLLMNCDCWKHKGGKEILSKLSDNQLKALETNFLGNAKYVIAVNQAKKTLNAKGLDYNALGGLLGLKSNTDNPVAFLSDLGNALESLSTHIKGNATPPDKGGKGMGGGCQDPSEPDADDEMMGNASEDDFTEAEAKAYQGALDAGYPSDVAAAMAYSTANASEDENGDGLPDEESGSAGSKKYFPAKNSKGNMKNNSRLTPEEQEDLEYARQVKNREKMAIVNKLIANIQNKKVRNAKGNFLMQKSLKELKQLVDLIPQPIVNRSAFNFDQTENGYNQQMTGASYAGMGGFTNNSSFTNNSEEDLEDATLPNIPGTMYNGSSDE